MGFDNQVWIALISTAGGIIVTYLTVKYKNVVTKRNNPKDRMETIFDGYEALIKQQQIDIQRKTVLIEHLQAIVDSQRVEIEKSQGLINDLREELHDSDSKTQELRLQLHDMKKDYHNHTENQMEAK